jgi:hypothetical protein
LLKEEEYDFEQRDTLGRTALLDNLTTSSELSLVVTRLLLEFGSNIQAIDNRGQNALQIAMRGNNRGVTEQKLSLLIKAGADVNHCDEDGYTPYDTALKSDCWEEWCRALEFNGFNISEFMGSDEEAEEELDEEWDREAEGRHG